jgi:hypothetical protein
MLAKSRPADRLVHSICVIAAAAIVCTLLRPRRIAPRPASVDMAQVRRLQLWGRWLQTPALN